MRQDGIDETVASRVIELCRLQCRFTDIISKLAEAGDVGFVHQTRLPEQDWFGALHYMELVESTEGVNTKMHVVYAPSLPRVGEIVTPQNGPPMLVVGVDHVVASQGEGEGVGYHTLIPHVLLEAIEEDDSDEDE